MSLIIPTVISFPYMDANNQFFLPNTSIITGNYMYVNEYNLQINGFWVGNIFYAQLSTSTITWNIFIAQFNSDNTMTSKYFIETTLPSTPEEIYVLINNLINEVESNTASQSNWNGIFSYTNDITYGNFSYTQSPDDTYFTYESNITYDNISSLVNYGTISSNETFTSNFGIQFQVNDVIPGSGQSSAYGSEIGTQDFWVSLSGQTNTTVTDISTGGSDVFPSYNFTFNDGTNPTVTILFIKTYVCLMINNLSVLAVDTLTLGNYTPTPQYFKWYDTGVFDPMTISNVSWFTLTSTPIPSPTPEPIPCPPTQMQLPISNICFPAGTPVMTNKGNIPIERLKPGFHTIYKKQIANITQTVSTDNYLVCFEKNALGDFPSQKTTMSKDHRILYRGKMVPAKNFVRYFKNVRKIKYTGEILYNVVLENYDVMSINGMLCETLHPENEVAKIYKGKRFK